MLRRSRPRTSAPTKRSLIFAQAPIFRDLASVPAPPEYGQTPSAL